MMPRMQDSAAEREWKIIPGLTLAAVVVVGSLHSAWQLYVATGNPLVLVELTGFWIAAALAGWQSWRLREVERRSRRRAWQ